MVVLSPSSSILPDGVIVDYWSLLPEDVWFEILRRLPTDLVFKLWVVSKVWHSTLSNPDFKTRWIKHNSLPETILFYNLEDSITSKNTVIKHIIPNRSIRRGPCVAWAASLDNSLTFIRKHDVFSFKFLSQVHQRLYLLASTNGLILCSSGYNSPWMNFFVCNPLTKRYVKLPEPSYLFPDHDYLFGFVSDSYSSVYYKVVLIEELTLPSNGFVLYIFCSDLQEWETHCVSCPDLITMKKSLSSNVVNSCGVLYWIEGEGDRIVACDLNRDMRCSLIRLPKRDNNQKDEYQCLGESEGSIMYSRRQGGELEVWLLEGSSSVWHLVHKIETQHMLFPCHGAERYGSTVDFRHTAFNPVDRNIMILTCSYGIFTYSIATRKLKQLKLVGYTHRDGYRNPIMLAPWVTAL
ncbi:F-box protein At5g03970-like [Papaver somniferum]|uniref:F-box protein At5g03970-like n=1 Tax=Papaver somniferum TaxID=3469 RepID=UPI000E702D93|nr:F-box protein At5g03970-like [Papaver somniferum]